MKRRKGNERKGLKNKMNRRYNYEKRNEMIERA
jgi:hypothetical protein